MYSLCALLAAGVVVVIEVAWARTGIFTKASYWTTMVITFGFQILVDGWLTKLSAPIVRYNAHEFSGVRFPWDIPVEDFVYGFALVTLVLVLWVRRGGAPSPSESQGRTATAEQE